MSNEGSSVIGILKSFILSTQFFTILKLIITSSSPTPTQQLLTNLGGTFNFIVAPKLLGLGGYIIIKEIYMDRAPQR
jgi:hypothetical protein